MTQTERSKLQILTWAKKHGRKPNRRAEKTRERVLGQRMENFCSPASPLFDYEFRAVIKKTYGIKRNPKGKHNPKRRLRELYRFIRLNGRTPSKAMGDGKIASTFSNFATPSANNYSPSIVAKIRQMDPCHGSLIPRKFRQSINGALKVSKKKLKEEQKNGTGKN